jgi:hypothetical protein
MRVVSGGRVESGRGRVILSCDVSRGGKAKIALSRRRREVSPGSGRTPPIGATAPGTTPVVEPGGRIESGYKAPTPLVSG